MKSTRIALNILLIAERLEIAIYKFEHCALDKQMITEFVISIMNCCYDLLGLHLRIKELDDANEAPTQSASEMLQELMRLRDWHDLQLLKEDGES